jgi:hypothetical protein
MGCNKCEGQEGRGMRRVEKRTKKRTKKDVKEDRDGDWILKKK